MEIFGLFLKPQPEWFSKRIVTLAQQYNRLRCSMAFRSKNFNHRQQPKTFYLLVGMLSGRIEDQAFAAHALHVGGKFTRLVRIQIRLRTVARDGIQD